MLLLLLLKSTILITRDWKSLLSHIFFNKNESDVLQAQKPLAFRRLFFREKFYHL